MTTAFPAGDRHVSCLAKGHHAKSEISRKKAQENIADKEACAGEILSHALSLQFFHPLEKCAVLSERPTVRRIWKVEERRR